MKTIEQVSITRIDSHHHKKIQCQDDVIIECPLKIYINESHYCTLMCTPQDLKALAVGFLFFEKIIDSLDEVKTVIEDVDTLSLYVSLNKIFTPNPGAKVIASSSARTSIASLEVKEPVERTLLVSDERLFDLVDQLFNSQQIFKQTGATHAAGVFNQAGKVILACEDVGRHNALDKVIGKCLLNSIEMQNCGVVLSSRVSYEMASKAIHAGFHTIVAVSAPTALAIDLAKKNNVALYGFVRGKKANKYL